MSRPWTSVIIAAGLLLAGCAAEPKRGEFVGMPRSQVTAKLGQPRKERAGYIGSPPPDYRSEHPASTTAIFPRRGGDQYVSFELVDGEQVVYDSMWVPRDVVID